MPPLRIVVTGLIGQHHTLGGVTWDYLQYPVGLSRLGHDVYYLEDSGEWPYKSDGGPNGDDWVARDCKPNVTHLDHVFSAFGLAGRWAYRFPRDGQWFGLADRERDEILGSADLLLNISGTLENPLRYRQVRALVYVDSDPGFTQAKLARGDRAFGDRVRAHDLHFTFSESRHARLPPTAYHWRPTRQPIVLSEWEPIEPHREVFTTVMSWTSYPPLTVHGTPYRQKDAEFLRFVTLPAQVTPTVLEVALSATEHANWRTELSTVAGVPCALRDAPPTTARELLAACGWHVVAASEFCNDFEAYRRYIASSKAEWSVAKSGYVIARTGWFSCRSACYLAAGRPVVVQDTGFSEVIPTGEGILAFRDLHEAAQAVRDVESEYEAHSEAARRLARRYFDSDRVLGQFLEDVRSEVGEAVG
jgi:hypothetical protein